MISELKLGALRRALATIEYGAQVAADGTVQIVQIRKVKQVKQCSKPGPIFGQVAADGTVHIVQRSQPRTIFGHTPACLLCRYGGVIAVAGAGILVDLYVVPRLPQAAWILVVYVMAVVALRPSRHMRANLTGFRATLTGFSVQSLTNTAALLAGSKRPALRAEWAAHIAGESGHDPASWQKVKQAFGFLTSAIYYRCSDMAEAIWVPVDRIFKSRVLSNTFVMIPTTVAGWFVLRHEGTLGLINSAESIAAVAGVLYGLIRTGRWWRDVKPPEPKARRAEKLP